LPQRYSRRIGTGGFRMITKHGRREFLLQMSRTGASLWWISVTPDLPICLSNGSVKKRKRNRLFRINFPNRYRKSRLSPRNRNPENRSFDMANRKRNIMVRFRVTPEEKSMIEEKMTQVGTSNMEAYLRKMSIDGYILKLDLPELKEMISLLRRSSNNFNQIAKRMNQTSRIYEADIECLRENQEKLWNMANKILTQLAAIK